MSRPFKIEIAESEEELKKRLQNARWGNQKEKLQMLWWLKSSQVKEQQEIGQRLARDTSTVTRWLPKYRTGGLSSLLERKFPFDKKLQPVLCENHTHSLCAFTGYKSKKLTTNLKLFVVDLSVELFSQNLKTLHYNLLELYFS
jgi:hypothetical protein